MSNQITIDNTLIKYLEKIGYRPDEILENLIEETKTFGSVSEMLISREQCQFLELLVKISKTMTCLEIGRFTGLSSLCLARGLPQTGKLTSVDISSEFLKIAEKYWKLAKVDHKIHSIIAPGVEAMQSFIDRQFFYDLIFIDADKNNYPNYYELSLKLIKPNGILLIDNMLWHGDVADNNLNDKTTSTIRKLNKKIKNDLRVDYSFLPLADGIMFIIKK